MAEVFAPFIIDRTIGNRTFYRMEGKNYVRKKSSLTRKKALHSPRFESTRHYAGLMARASKIGSLVYKALPAYWRQFWMYRSFTGEALTMLKAGKTEQQVQQQLWAQYVKEVADKQTPTTGVPVVDAPPKRRYQKHNTAYWTRKTIKARRQKMNKQRLFHHAGLLARASKLASVIYQRLALKCPKRCYYRKLVALALELLDAEVPEADMVTVLMSMIQKNTPSQRESCSDQLPQPVKKKTTGVIHHAKGYRYFIPSVYNVKTTFIPIPDLYKFDDRLLLFPGTKSEGGAMLF